MNSESNFKVLVNGKLVSVKAKQVATGVISIPAKALPTSR